MEIDPFKMGQHKAGDPTPDGLGDDLIRQCKEFMAVAVPSSNIIFADEFNKFMPLFNKTLYDQTEPTDIDELAREYNSRFSMQHPIQLLTRVRDERGVLYPGDRHRYKLDKEIPAMFRRVSTLNNLGRKVPALMNALYNSVVKTSGPFDHRKAEYSKAIAQAIGLADKKEGKIEQQRAAFARASKNLTSKAPVAKPAEVEKPAEDEEATTGMIDWG